MEVRELIADLLEYDMDEEVKIRVKFSNTTEEETIYELDSSAILNEVYLEIDLTSDSLIDKDRLEKLEEKEERLEESENG